MTKAPWARLGAEFVVILTGVLLALGVDATWDSRVDQRRAEAYLDQLRAELAVTDRDAQRAIERETGVVFHASEVLGGLYEPRLPPSDSLTEWLSRMFTSSSFVPTTSTIEALVTTGDLQLVEDDGLRTEIVRYRQASEQLVRTFAIQDELLIETVQRIGLRVDLPRLFADGNLGVGEGPVLPWRTLASDTAFRSELFHVQSAAGNRLRALTEFQERLAALRVALG